MDNAGALWLPIPLALRTLPSREDAELFDVTGLRPSNDDRTGELETFDANELLESTLVREPVLPGLIRSFAKRSPRVSELVAPPESPVKTCPFLFASSASTPETEALEYREVGTC